MAWIKIQFMHGSSLASESHAETQTGQSIMLCLLQIMMAVEEVMGAGMEGVGMAGGVKLTEGDEGVGGGYKAAGKMETLIIPSLAREAEQVDGAEAVLGDATPDMYKAYIENSRTCVDVSSAHGHTPKLAW